jgi:integrase
VEHLGLFIIWLQHGGPQTSGTDVVPGGLVLAGPGRAPVRGVRRVNAVLCAVRGFVAHAVTSGQAPAGLLALIYELADERDLPEQARGEDARMAWRMRARHRLREPDTRVERAGDEQIVALLRGCRSARDRLIVLLMARAGLRRGELCGLRRGDVHLLPDSRLLGCEVERAHLHVVRRDNSNGAWAKSRRERVVPLDFLVVQGFDGYEFERLGVARAAESDFVLVNLFRGPVGAPMRPDAINELMTACSRRAGLDPPLRPHQLRHAFGSNVADAGGSLDEIAELLGHASMSSSQVYLHPDLGRLRAAVERVPSPREQAGAGR